MSRVIEETDEYTDVEVTSNDWRDEDPPAGAWRSVRREWKPGHEPPPSSEERIAALEDEVREMRERIDRPARD